MTQLPHQSYKVIGREEFVAAMRVWVPVDVAAERERAARGDRERYRMALEAIVIVVGGAYDSAAVHASEIAQAALHA